MLKDPGLLGDVPATGVRVVATRTLEPRDLMLVMLKLGMRRLVDRLQPWFMVPDDQRGWVPFAVRAGRRLLTRGRFDAILSTASPYSAHLVGRALHRVSAAGASPAVPWIADFRDEWTTNPYIDPRYPTAWHRALNRRLETEVVREATRVTAVSRPWLDSIHAVAPELPDAKFAVMENGFDPEHFAGLSDERPDRFRIVYTGMFYGHRSPVPFLEAVRAVLADGSIPARDLEVVFVGHTADAAGLDAGGAGVLRVVEQRPYREALNLLGRAAALLLVVPRAGGAGNHTGKLFPYLASGRPILCLAPEPNVAADLVREARAGVVAPPDDPAAIARALVGLYADWKRTGAPRPARDEALVARHGADRQVLDWVDLLERAGQG